MSLNRSRDTLQKGFFLIQTAGKTMFNFINVSLELEGRVSETIQNLLLPKGFSIA